MLKSWMSFHTIRSLDSSSIDEDQANRKHDNVGSIHTHIFEELLPIICAKFGCEFDVIVTRHSGSINDRHEHTSKKEGSRKKKKKIFPSSSNPETQNQDAADDDVLTLRLGALYDKNNSLVEIYAQNQPRIPRSLLQAVIVIAPLYDYVRKITIRRSKVDAFNIYQLDQLVSLMNLTEVCLDDTLFFPEANYAILLQNKNTLRQLSLCRCSITDVVCQQIVSKLHYPAHAEKTLLILNLSGNSITDEGAEHIGQMLRTNRVLRYLNLAGNRIGDAGAEAILEPLAEFQLTYDEIAEKRRIILSYLKRKRELLKKFISISLKADAKEKHPGMDQKKAEMTAIKLIGELHEQGPFGPSDTVIKDDWSYSTGNFKLAHLNISYNNLSYFSVKKVLAVLDYQRCSSTTGLLRVILDGNNIPKACKEYADISALLNKKLTIHSKGSRINSSKIRINRISRSANNTARK